MPDSPTAEEIAAAIAANDPSARREQGKRAVNDAIRGLAANSRQAREERILAKQNRYKLVPGAAGPRKEPISREETD